mmetsp:Transcript_33609/g.78553  ORF Transcript_33609/g.78553 Transcript_33609/m.78553 type:complete len:84 (+) Transcript_33609:154-405(+)
MGQSAGGSSGGDGGSSSGGGGGSGWSKADRDNHSNQCNPNHRSYQGYDRHYSGSGTRADLNNHANQMNPNNSAYYSSRGIDRK